MALTYGQLTQAIEDYLQYNDATFVSNIGLIVRQAEDRIYQSVQTPVERKNSTGYLTSNNQYLASPADMLSVASFAVINPTTGQYTYMLSRQPSFIREAFPFPGTTGTPNCYGFFNQTTFIVGPTPDTGYQVELNYHAKPASITSGDTNTTTWISSYFESVLLSACLLEAYIFLKGDADLLQLYDNRYKEALSTFQLLGEGLDERDSYRSGTKRVEVKS